MHVAACGWCACVLPSPVYLLVQAIAGARHLFSCDVPLRVRMNAVNSMHGVLHVTVFCFSMHTHCIEVLLLCMSVRVLFQPCCAAYVICYVAW